MQDQISIPSNKSQRHLSNLIMKQQSLNTLVGAIQKEYKTYTDLKIIEMAVVNMEFFKRFFQSIDQNSIQEICRRLTIEKFDPGDVIIKQGDLSNDKMYIIASGQVCVCIKNDDAIPNSGFSLQLGKKLNNKMAQLFTEFGKPIDVIFQGEGFGELALLAKSKQSSKRKATIISTTDTILIVLDKDSYLHCIENQGLSNNKKKILNQCFPFMNNVNSEQLKQFLYLNIQDKELRKDQVLCQENTKGQFIYLISKGIVKLTKIIYFDEKYCKEKHLLIVVECGESNIVGDEILFNQTEEYEYTVTVSEIKSNSYLEGFLLIPKQVFLGRFPIEVINQFRKQYKSRDSQRKEIIKLQVQKKVEKIDEKLNQEENIQKTLYDFEQKNLIGKMQERVLGTKIKVAYHDMQNQTQQNYFSTEENSESNDQFKNNQSSEIRRRYNIKKIQTNILQNRITEFKNNIRDHHEEGKLKSDFSNSNANKQLADILKIFTQNKKKSIDQNIFEKLIGTQEILLKNPVTNKFFPITNQGGKQSPRKIKIQEDEDQLKHLDFGQIEEFNKTKKYKLIRLGLFKNEKDERPLHQQLQQLKQQQIFRPQTSAKHSRSPQISARKSRTPKQIIKVDESLHKEGDPYLMIMSRSRSQSERRKILSRKQKRIKIINKRIQDTFHSFYTLSQ